MVEVSVEEGGKSYIIRAFSTMYVDWGLEIMNDQGESLFYSPSALCNESYGFTWYDEDGELLEEPIEWTEQEWQEVLQDEAWQFLEAYLPEEEMMSLYPQTEELIREGVSWKS